MPTECIANPLQRELADSIIRMAPLDEIRILLACGAKVRMYSFTCCLDVNNKILLIYFETMKLVVIVDP